MQNERVLGRSLARELSIEETKQVGGGANGDCGTAVPCTCRIDGGDDYCCDFDG